MKKGQKIGNIIRHSPPCARWKIPKCTERTMLQFYISAGPSARTLEMTQMEWALLVITRTICEKKCCTSHMKVTSSNCLTILRITKWCKLFDVNYTPHIHTHSPKTIIKKVISRNLSSLFFACNSGIFSTTFHSSIPSIP